MLYFNNEEGWRVGIINIENIITQKGRWRAGPLGSNLN